METPVSAVSEGDASAGFRFSEEEGAGLPFAISPGDAGEDGSGRRPGGGLLGLWDACVRLLPSGCTPYLMPTSLS